VNRTQRIVCVQAPAGEQWQVATRSSRPLALVGWRTDLEQERDAGVPQTVRAVFAAALSCVGCVTFPYSERLEPGSDDVVRALPARGLSEKWNALRARMPATIQVITSRQVETVQHLFDDAGFPWCLQGQVALISPHDAAPPMFDRSKLFAWIDPARALDWEELVLLGVNTAIRAGVDGDVMAVMSESESTETSVLASLERHARSAGFDWAMLSESDFTNALAGDR